MLFLVNRKKGIVLFFTAKVGHYELVSLTQEAQLIQSKRVKGTAATSNGGQRFTLAFSFSVSTQIYCEF